MAIELLTQYPGKIAPATPSYPFGAARNITNPGDGTGTPWEAALVNDILGHQQALLTGAGLVPSGSTETALSSQFLQAQLYLLAGFPTVSELAACALSPGNIARVRDRGAAYLIQPDTYSAKPGDVTLANGNIAAVLVQSFLDLRYFGAKGDGVTDDTAAIQLALDYLASDDDVRAISGGGLKYALDGTVSLDTAGQPSAFNKMLLNTFLVAGSGMSSGSTMLSVDASNCRVYQCGFDCKRVGNALEIPTAALGTMVTNTRFDKPLDFGVAFQNGGGDSLIANNYFSNDDPAQKTATGILGNTGDITVMGNTMQQMALSAYFKFGGVLFQGNHIYQGQGGGTETSTMSAGLILDGDDTIVTGNYFDKCRVHVDNGYDPSRQRSERRSITINDNLFYTNANYTTQDSFIRFRPRQAGVDLKDILIKDNQFANANGPTAPDLNMALTFGTGDYAASKVSMYGNKGSDVNESSTRGRKNITIPSSTLSVTERVTTANDPFGEFTYLQAHLSNNPGAKTLVTTPNNYDQASYVFNLDSTHTTDTILSAEVMSDAEF